MIYINIFKKHLGVYFLTILPKKHSHHGLAKMPTTLSTAYVDKKFLATNLPDWVRRPYDVSPELYFPSNEVYPCIRSFHKLAGRFGS